MKRHKEGITMKNTMEDIARKQRHWKWESLTTTPELNEEVKKMLNDNYYERYALKRITELEQEVARLKERQ